MLELDKKEIIHQCLVDQFSITDDQIKETTHLAQDYDADSLDMVELVMELEDHLDIEILDEEIDTLITVGDLYQIVETKLR